MEQFDQKTKDEITKLIEIILEPISGKVKEIGEPFQMGHIVQQGFQDESRWNEYLYTVLIDSSVGEIIITISSLHMPDPWDMVEVAIRTDLSLKNKLPEDISTRINEIIYSPEFLALRIKK